MTDAQKKIIYIVLLTISGSAASSIANLFHVVPADVQPYLDALKALTAALGGAWGLTAFTAGGVVQTASTLPPAQAAQALSQVSDSAKVRVAEAVPGVATVVLNNNVTNGLAKLAADDAHPNIVTASENAKDVLAGTRAAP